MAETWPGKNAGEATEVIPEVPEPKTTYPFGMTKEESVIIDAIASVLKDMPFSIGQFCERANLESDDCVHLFRRLHAIGVLRCPVNDGGCELFQLVPELARRLNARTDD